MKDLTTLPDDLPVPVDDGACDHLPGMKMPALDLAATSGDTVNLASMPGTIIAYVFPKIGRPDSPPMVGWNEIPGARGCTPQSCAFRDHHTELRQYASAVYGVSAQPLADQYEARQRLELPFELLNDSEFELTNALRLPTFEYQGQRLIKRLTLIIEDGVIQKVFYPVFPPDKNAEEVVAWFERQSVSQGA